MTTFELEQPYWDQGRVVEHECTSARCYGPDCLCIHRCMYIHFRFGLFALCFIIDWIKKYIGVSIQQNIDA